MFIKNKKDTDYTDIVKHVYRLITDRFGYSSRITDIWTMLKLAFDIEEFEAIEPKFYQNGPFESYLIDKQIEWQSGKDVDFSEIAESIINTGDFSVREKDLFRVGNIEERLWGIYLAVSDHNLNL